MVNYNEKEDKNAAAAATAAAAGGGSQAVYLVYCGFRPGRRIIDEFRQSMRSG